MPAPPASPKKTWLDSSDADRRAWMRLLHREKRRTGEQDLDLSTLLLRMLPRAGDDGELVAPVISAEKALRGAERTSDE